MTDGTDQVDELLNELDLASGDSVETSRTKDREIEEELSGEESDQVERLDKLNDAGVISDEEYEVLLAHSEGGMGSSGGDVNNASSNSGFGKPIATSEGENVDFSLVGVFEDIDTTELVKPQFTEALDEEDLPPQFQGGTGRTIVCWQIFNHGKEEFQFSHNNLEQIGADGIAYNQDDNPLQEERFKPGWRTEKLVDIAADTRIKYASCIEIPVQLTEVRITGYSKTRMSAYNIEDRAIEITDEMRFPGSELPVTVDL